jgi:3-methyladenine DNA glycosylase AlkD
MNTDDVLALLEENKNLKGIENWEKMSKTGGLSSYGIGLTVQRKLAKQIGKNRELSQALWKVNNYDARVISLLIDDPKQITEAQAEQQVEELNAGMLNHVFSSCDATLPKAPIAFEIAQRWLVSEDEMRRRCGLGLAYEFSKKKTKTYTNEFFLSVINMISERHPHVSKMERLSMGTALMGIGKRSKELNLAALKVAQDIGPIDFNDDGQKCDPFDVEKHLTSDYLKDKLGL